MQTSVPLRLLIIDDSRDDTLLMARALRQGGFDVSFQQVFTREAMETALNEDWDIILSDYSIPEFCGLEALRILNAKEGDIPFIIISGVIDEERAVAAMKAGARDYIRKSDLKRLAPAVERELRESGKRRALRKRYQGFAKLGQSLSSATSPQEAARIITTVADELFGWDSCFIDLYAHGREKCYQVFAVDTFDDERREVSAEGWALDPTPLREEVLACGPRLILRSEPAFEHKNLRPFGDKNRPSASILIVLVRNGTQVLGFFSIQSYSPNAYNQEDLDTLQALADYCGGAFERIRLQKEILEISSREQRRLGQLLHDGICQHLAGISFLTEILGDKLEEKQAPEAADSRKICNLIDDALIQTRGIARGLFPVQLEENGLVSALQELIFNSESLFKIRCTFRCKEPVLLRDNALAEHLYYIAHESLMNAVKHGAAKHISISLEPGEKHNTLSVRDDGVGMHAQNGNGNENRSGKGMGLHIMNYRAQMIGAKLTIEAQQNNGTLVTCLFPKK
ncbi:MAG: response regulator [Verrucomicrobia bacterium]|nr:response regulator [Verrucomicrobiota bacterium]